MRLHSRTHFFSGLSLLGLILAAGLFVRFVPAGSRARRLYPGCMLYRTTGFHCGGCGGTRALEALSHGDLLQAVAWNPVAALVIFPAIFLWIAHQLCFGWGGRRLIPWASIPLWAYIALAVFFLIFSVVRNIPAHPFTLLAPHRLESPSSPAPPSTRENASQVPPPSRSR